jgi:hypothetical protein
MVDGAACRVITVKILYYKAILVAHALFGEKRTGCTKAGGYLISLGGK